MKAWHSSAGDSVFFAQLPKPGHLLTGTLDRFLRIFDGRWTVASLP